MSRAVPEFRQLLVSLADDLGSKIDRLGESVGRLDRGELLAFITDAYPELVTPYIAEAQDATATWYEDQPTLAGAKRFHAEPAALPSVEQLATSGRWAIGQSDSAAALKGSAKRSIFRGSRNTVVANARREGVRWARYARPGACGFCRMLATRSVTVGGSLYLSEGTALAASRSHIVKGHDWCTCLVVPDRDGEYVGPDYVQQWAADYERATKEGARSAGEIAQAMERIGNERDARAAAGAVQRRQDANVAAWLDAEFEHRAAVEYWRRVDAEDLHAMPAPEPKRAPAESPMDRAIRELDEAVASGDNDRIEAAAVALEELEATERKDAERKARRREQAYDRRAAAANEQADRILELIEQGYEPAEAEADVTGKSIESIRRRDFMASARAEGHSGTSFEQLLSSVYYRRVNELAIEAENATNGYMLKKKYEGKGNVKELWTGSDKRARELMSEEMAAWFDENGGRLTRQIFKQMILSGQYGLRRYTSSGEDYLQ